MAQEGGQPAGRGEVWLLPPVGGAGEAYWVILDNSGLEEVCSVPAARHVRHPCTPAPPSTYHQSQQLAPHHRFRHCHSPLPHPVVPGWAAEGPWVGPGWSVQLSPQWFPHDLEGIVCHMTIT